MKFNDIYETNLRMTNFILSPDRLELDNGSIISEGEHKALTISCDMGMTIFWIGPFDISITTKNETGSCLNND